MKRFRLVVRASDVRLDELGASSASSTGENEVLKAVKSVGLEVEEVEGLDWWPDPAATVSDLQAVPYTKHASRDGCYYYVKGGDLPFPRFCVIREDLHETPDRWVRDWITGNPAAVLYFAFWKLKLDQDSPATDAEVEWYRGFVVAAERAQASAQGS